MSRSSQIIPIDYNIKRLSKFCHDTLIITEDSVVRLFLNRATNYLEYKDSVINVRGNKKLQPLKNIITINAFMYEIR